MFSSLFPDVVQTVFMREEPDLGLLLPDELECVRTAAPKRRREFAMGRICARRALARLGIRDFPLLVGRDRSPIWPPGVIGSLSHTRAICAVGVGRAGDVAGIGIDLETAADLDEKLFRMVLTPGERAMLETLAARESGRLAKILFSAKESVFKCAHPLTGVALRFQDCEIDLRPDARVFSARVTAKSLPPPWRGRILTGRYVISGDHVGTGVLLTPSELEGRRHAAP